MSSGTHHHLSQALSMAHLGTSRIQMGFPEKDLRAVCSYGKPKAESHSDHSTELTESWKKKGLGRAPISTLLLQ